MSALSPGEKAVESAQPREASFEGWQTVWETALSTLLPGTQYVETSVYVAYVYVRMCICINNNMYICIIF